MTSGLVASNRLELLSSSLLQGLVRRAIALFKHMNGHAHTGVHSPLWAPAIHPLALPRPAEPQFSHKRPPQSRVEGSF
jgi:hypothetical protein